jgi:hypothetical protein
MEALARLVYITAKPQSSAMFATGRQNTIDRA